MRVRAMDMYGLIGALKSHFMYQNSKLHKAKRDGKEYKPRGKAIRPDDMLFLLVEELEKAMEQVEDVPSANDIDVNIITRDPNEQVPVEVVYEQPEVDMSATKIELPPF